MGKMFRLWIKSLWDQKTKWLIFALFITAIIGIGSLFSSVYGFNDDVMMRSILSGDYTGTPNGHTVYMRYPFTGVLSSLYRLNPKIPWLTLFFAGCMGSCVFLLFQLTIKQIKHKLYKILGGLLTAEAVVLLLFRQYIIMHYTVVAAVLGGTALFLVTVQDKKEAEWIKFSINKKENKKYIKTRNPYKNIIRMGSIFLFYL